MSKSINRNAGASASANSAAAGETPVDGARERAGCDLCGSQELAIKLTAHLDDGRARKVRLCRACLRSPMPIRAIDPHLRFMIGILRPVVDMVAKP
jgi:hypothetical protein